MGQVRTPGSSLSAGFAWTFAGNAVNGISQWAILGLIAKLSTPEVLGQYALALAVATPVAMLSHLNLRSVLSTDVNRLQPFTDYFVVRALSSVVGFIATTLLGTFWHPFWPVGMSIVILGAALQAENFQDLYYAVMQRNDQLDRIAKSMLIRAGFTIAAVGGLLLISRNSAAAAAGVLFGRSCTLFLFDLRAGQAPFERRLAPMTVFQSAVPLGLTLMLVSLSAGIPRYFIERIYGAAMLGTFVAVASFTTVGLTIMNALGQSATTRLATAFAEHKYPLFRSLAIKLCLFAAGIGLAGALIAFFGGRFFLSLVYRPEYAQNQWLLVEMMLAGTVTYVAVILGFVTTSTRRFKEQLPLLIAVAATSALVSLHQIPGRGLRGAVLALATAALVQIVGLLLILRKAL